MRASPILGIQPSPVGLTGRQRTCKAVISTSIGLGLGPPTFAEIGEVMGIKSKSGVHELVMRLAERGHLVLRGQVPKLELPPQTTKFFTVERIDGQAVLVPLQRRAVA